jgi:hypothetical protein
MVIARARRSIVLQAESRTELKNVSWTHHFDGVCDCRLVRSTGLACDVADEVAGDNPCGLG